MAKSQAVIGTTQMKEIHWSKEKLDQIKRASPLLSPPCQMEK